MSIIQSLQKENGKDKYVVLDLDDTCIHSLVNQKEVKKWKKNPKRKEHVDKFTWHNMDDYYLVCERPDLQNFLDYLFENFNVIVWTAASKDYALFIIKNCIIAGRANRQLKYVFFDYHCDISQEVYKFENTPQKCLKLITEKGPFGLPGIEIENILIIDDLKDNKKSNGNNCIQIFPFKVHGIGSENDNHLMGVVKDQLDVFLNNGIKPDKLQM
tara:strand:+ start:85 stop:726 length:642 start_codon:yes stop_codon:yes gene_type:complete